MCDEFKTSDEEHADALAKFDDLLPKLLPWLTDEMAALVPLARSRCCAIGRISGNYWRWSHAGKSPAQAFGVFQTMLQAPSEPKRFSKLRYLQGVRDEKVIQLAVSLPYQWIEPKEWRLRGV